MVDVDSDEEDAYANHCATVDAQTRPLRDCITDYNGRGEAKRGGLAYYGGGQGHKIRVKAQGSLEPYRFEGQKAP